jgi:predicted kinase
MRKWMRDRMKRRKAPGKPERGGSIEPGQVPLQPTFLDRAAPVPPQSEEAEAGKRDLPEPPERAADERAKPDQAGAPGLEPLAEPPPAERAQAGGGVEAGAPARRERPAGRSGGRRDRSRRRGRGGRPQVPAKPQPLQGGRAAGAVLPIAPGQATGEAAEVDGEMGTETAAPEAEASPATAPGKIKGAVVLSIGLPGSGKSSWFRRHNLIPLSSDLIRGLLFDNPTEQRHQDLVFSSLRSLLRARLIAGRPMNYIDATNLSPRERHSWIKMARDYGYEAHAVFFDVPAEVCMERNRRRARNVPDDVMHRMVQKLRPPKFEEGFAKIIVVRLKRHEQAEEEQQP